MCLSSSALFVIGNESYGTGAIGKIMGSRWVNIASHTTWRTRSAYMNGDKSRTCDTREVYSANTIRRQSTEISRLRDELWSEHENSQQLGAALALNELAGLEAEVKGLCDEESESRDHTITHLESQLMQLEGAMKQQQFILQQVCKAKPFEVTPPASLATGSQVMCWLWTYRGSSLMFEVFGLWKNIFLRNCLATSALVTDDAYAELQCKPPEQMILKEEIQQLNDEISSCENHTRVVYAEVDSISEETKNLRQDVRTLEVDTPSFRRTQYNWNAIWGARERLEYNLRRESATVEYLQEQTQQMKTETRATLKLWATEEPELVTSIKREMDVLEQAALRTATAAETDMLAMHRKMRRLSMKGFDTNALPGCQILNARLASTEHELYQVEHATLTAVGDLEGRVESQTEAYERALSEVEQLKMEAKYRLAEADEVTQRNMMMMQSFRGEVSEAIEEVMIPTCDFHELRDTLVSMGAELDELASADWSQASGLVSRRM